jgi:hypothetical protein
VTRCFCEKIAHGTNNPPNQFYLTKITPKSLGNYFLEKKSPNGKYFLPKWQNFSQFGHTDFRRKSDFVERVLTKGPGFCGNDGVSQDKIYNVTELKILGTPDES